MADKNDKDGSSPDRHPAVDIAGRVSKLLDRGTITPQELENDEYDGSEPIEDWLRERGGPKS